VENDFLVVLTRGRNDRARTTDAPGKAWSTASGEWRICQARSPP